MRPWILLSSVVFLLACDPASDSPSEGASSQQEGASSAGPDAINAAVGHPDRPDEDKARDEQRKPGQIMRIAGFEPGMKVLDLFSGQGWYTELLSRVVGPDGEVYAQNPPVYLEKFGDEGITNRLAGDRLPNVVRYDRPMESMELPSEYFDAVMAAMIVHDLFWLTGNVPAVLQQLHEALKPGGFVLVTDHAAPTGTGSTFAEDRRGQHRVEEALVKRLFLESGFDLVAESGLLRNPDDDRTKPFFAPEMKGKHTDRFVLKFRKPR